MKDGVKGWGGWYFFVVRKKLKDEIVTKWGQSSNQTEEGRQNTDVTATQTGKQTDKHTFRNT